MQDKRIGKLLPPLQARQPLVEELISRSLLSVSGKRAYWLDYLTRREQLGM